MAGITLVLWIFILLASSHLASALKVGTYIAYLGDVPPKIHPDEVTKKHHSLLKTVFETTESANESLVYSYRHGLNGFAARLSEHQAATIAEHPDVISIFPSQKLSLHTTQSWYFTESLTSSQNLRNNFNSIWEATDYGDNTIIGMVDGGIWPESPSFSDAGLGPIPTRWRGYCEAGESFNSSNCNRKLIGARCFRESQNTKKDAKQGVIHSARDTEGHGTHTASTAAGSFVENASLLGQGWGTARGGAPKARIAAYKVCWLDEICDTADVLAGIDAAIHDRVDVISLSLGEKPYPFHESVNAIGTYHAVKHGIVAVCSAGNDGPELGTLANNAPWMITVGASSIDRNFTNYLELGNGNVIQGTAVSLKELDFRMYPLLLGEDAAAWDADYIDSRRCVEGSLDTTAAKGKIVACRMNEDDDFADEEVRRVGGAGIILYQNPMNVEEDVDARVFVIPGTAISSPAARDLFSYIRSSNESKFAYISHSLTMDGVQPAPYLAAFSSAGPNKIAPDIIKPDIVAPGLNILAAYTQHLRVGDAKADFNLMSGTSMATPHVAGVAALIKAYHPDWSPAAVLSAIVTTGYQLNNGGEPIKMLSGELATPFQLGGGHINPNAAAHPGLVYDATVHDYHQFLCSLGYSKSHMTTITGDTVHCKHAKKHAKRKHAKKKHGSGSFFDLNHPSITISSRLKKGGRVVTRTVTNVGDPTSKYEAIVEAPEGVLVHVQPSTLQFSSIGEKQSFTVTFSLDSKKMKRHKGKDKDKSKMPHFVFGSMKWVDHRHSVRSPIAVRLA